MCGSSLWHSKPGTHLSALLLSLFYARVTANLLHFLKNFYNTMVMDGETHIALTMYRINVGTVYVCVSVSPAILWPMLLVPTVGLASVGW